jgi:DNA-binding cell septation regulator SpoVG
MNNEIIVDLRLVNDQKAAKAIANITFDTAFGELTLERLRVIQQNGKEPWVAYPTIDFKSNETGEYVHLPIIKPGARLTKAISDAVLDEYKKTLDSKEPF